MRIVGWTARVLAVGLVGGPVVGGLAACGGGAAASADIVTPGQAGAVAQAYLRGDLAAEVAEESGSLARIDRGLMALRTPGPQPTADSQAHSETIWITHQSDYPVSFLCVNPLRAGDQMGGSELLRFSKAGAAAPWVVTHQAVLFPMSVVPAPAIDADGYLQTLSPNDAAKLLVAPASVVPDLAGYLQAGNASDHREFAAGVLTTTELGALQKRVADDSANHVTTTFSFAATGDPVVAYPMRDGSAVVLAGLQITERRVAQSGEITVTGDGKGVTGPAPGTYHQVTTVSLVVAAFVDPVKGGALRVSDIGAYYGAVSSTASRE